MGTPKLSTTKTAVTSPTIKATRGDVQRLACDTRCVRAGALPDGLYAGSLSMSSGNTSRGIARSPQHRAAAASPTPLAAHRDDPTDLISTPVCQAQFRSVPRPYDRFGRSKLTFRNCCDVKVEFLIR
jgi:hypothetical protein